MDSRHTCLNSLFQPSPTSPGLFSKMSNNFLFSSLKSVWIRFLPQTTKSVLTNTSKRFSQTGRLETVAGLKEQDHIIKNSIGSYTIREEGESSAGTGESGQELRSRPPSVAGGLQGLLWLENVPLSLVNAGNRKFILPVLPLAGVAAFKQRFQSLRKLTARALKPEGGGWHLFC